jgi:hypothetical protein
MQSMLLFSCFFASPSKNFAYLLGCANEKKMVVGCGFVGGVCTFLGAQIGKNVFQLYSHGRIYAFFLGTQIKKKMISNYTFMVWYLHFLDALIEKK